MPDVQSVSCDESGIVIITDKGKISILPSAIKSQDTADKGSVVGKKQRVSGALATNIELSIGLKAASIIIDYDSVTGLPISVGLS